jgi:hypothetical protein
MTAARARARAQGLARRWVIDRAIRLADPEDTLDPEWDDHRPLGDDEVEELFAWVKGRMADPMWELLPSDPEAREDFAYRLSEDLLGMNAAMWHPRALSMTDSMPPRSTSTIIAASRKSSRTVLAGRSHPNDATS